MTIVQFKLNQMILKIIITDNLILEDLETKDYESDEEWGDNVIETVSKQRVSSKIKQYLSLNLLFYKNIEINNT